MHNKLKRIVGSALLFSNFLQIAAAALPPPTANTHQQIRQQQDLQKKLPSFHPSGNYSNASSNEMQGVALSTNQFGIAGPLNAGVNYSNLTGAYFNGQFLKKISDRLGFNVLGEYGDNQARLNGTIGFLLGANTLFKFSAEQLRQTLPFLFSTGSVQQQVKQNAVGARFQQQFDFSILNNLSLGGYVAKAPNVRLATLNFISNGTNCLGFEAGLQCVNERNIAGGSSSGADLGLGSYLTPTTYLEGKLYYDSVSYNTIFSYGSRYDRSGYGGGVSAQQLLAANLKLTAAAEIRKIYNTYNLALSWMPPSYQASGTEFSLFTQRVVSHNQLPNDDTIGLKITFFADRVNYQSPVYALNGTPTVNNIASWISQPAVKMNQVLAISEEAIHLAGTVISAISPNFGPLSGGNLITITGTNFLSGAMVQFGGKIATITSMTATSLTVIVPPGDQAGGVPITVTTPDGKTTTVDNGYLYTNGVAPIVNTVSPPMGPAIGGSLVTINGANFAAGNTTVTIGGITIPANLVTVISPVSLTFVTPPHPVGTVIVTVTTPAGTSSPVPGGYTYEGVPTTTSLNPTAGPTAGGTVVTITGTDFAIGDTSVSINGTLIPASSVTVTSATTLTFSTPPHAAGNVAVSVATSGGASNQVPGGYNYDNAAATVSALSPVNGPVSGGTSVTLTGSNFVTGNTIVNIGGIVIPAGSVTVNSATSLTFNTPSHAAGNVPVSVTTPVGNSGLVPGGFTYEAVPVTVSLTPLAGPTAGGTLVTLIGTGFVTGDTSVTIGGNLIPSGSVTVNSANSLSFSTPAHAAGNVSVSVTTAGGTSNTVPGGFTYEDAPTSASLNPVTGLTTGGTVVTVTGTNFVVGDTSVTIGGTVVAAGFVTVNSSTSLTFSTPPHAAGNVAVTVSTSGGTSNPVSGGFTYQALPEITSVIPSAGPVTGGTSVTLSGSDFVIGDTSVTIGGNIIPTGSVTVNSTTSLTFITPAHAAGNVSVSVTTSAGTSGLVPGGFTYEDLPTTVSLTPPVGPAAGGTLVTIVGTNFITGDTSVTIGGTVISAGSVTVNSATSLTFTTPAHAAGNVSVSVATSGGAGNTVPGGFTYEETPTASSLSPVAGPVSGGTLINLTGTGFVAGTTSVTIDSMVIPAGSVSVNSPTSLSFSTPAHAAGNVSVSVSNSGGTSNLIPGGFTYVAAPTTTLLSPVTGPIAGGTSVTLTGTGFIAGDTVVTIGGITIPAGSVTVNSATSLTFTTPAHVAGNVAVSVVTAGGISNAVPGGFTYLATPVTVSLTPLAGPVSGGTVVTVIGTGFAMNDTAVTIGGTVIPANQVTVNSATSLNFSTPAHVAGNVAVSVSTSGGISNTVPGGFTYQAVPATVSLSPIAGPAAGGTAVTLIGSGFVAGDTTVSIGGTTIPAGSVTVNSATSLTFSTPAHAAGNVEVSVSTSGGSSNNVPGGFTYQAIPVTVSLAPTAGPIAGGTLVTVVGTDFAIGDTSVTIGGIVIPAGSVTVNSATSLSFITPAHAAGNVSVTVTTSGGVSNAVPGGFTYNNAAATVISLSPVYGPATGGTAVTIIGTNFVAGNTSVTVGGIVIPAGSVTVNSATSLTFNTPAHVAGNVSVNVTTPTGDSGFVPGGFTYEDVPALISLAPNAGPISGGTQVTLVGTGFIAGDTTVTIGGIVIPSGSVTVNSPVSLTFSTPAHAPGNVNVSVATTAGGNSNNVPGGFTYNNTAATVVSLSPVAGPVIGGTPVTVIGTNFVAGNTSVLIGGTLIPAGIVTVNSTSSLTFITPAHVSGNVDVSVITPVGNSGFVPGGFTYEAIPTTTLLSPVSGPVAGGTVVLVTGTGFIAGDTAVTIGGITIPAGAVTVNSTTSLSFSTPAHAAGNVSVSVSNAGGISNLVPGGFTYEAVPTTTLLAPATGPITGGTSVTLTGTGFVAGDTTVTIGGTIISAGSVTVNSPTSLSFNTPAHVAGNVAVSVTTAGGISNAVPGGFTYLAIPVTVSLAPVAGPVSGGTVVTVIGTGFAMNDTTVTIGGTVIPANQVTVNSDTSLSFSTPPHAAGNVVVNVSTSGGISNNIPGGFTYQIAPAVISLAPAAGPVTGGTLVTVIGSQFVVGDTTVSIGGITIPTGSVTVNSSTSLSFSTPAHAAGNVAVSVSTSGGLSNTVPGGFTYQATPATLSLTPTAGPITGGTLVTVVGTDFAIGDTTVTIGGTVIPVGSVTVNSATSLSFITPAHAAGNVSVSVSTSGGVSNVVPGGFTYLAIPVTASLSPTVGPVTGGTIVSLIGSGFVIGDTTVSIGGITIPAGSVTVNSATSLIFTTPAHAAGNVSVSVSTSGGVSNLVPGGFTYLAIPTTASLSPIAGPVAGNTLVTITGTGFVTGNTSVTIGGVLISAGSVTVNSSTLLSFSTPAHAAGNVSVSVATSGGVSNVVPGGFTYLATPVTASLTPTSGTTAGGTVVTVTGSNFVTGGTAITIGGTVVPASSVTVNSSTSLAFNTPAHAAGNVSVSVTTLGGISNVVPGGYTYLAPNLSSCSAPIPSLLGIQLLTCVGTNLTLFQTTFLQASGSAACSTFPTQSVLPSINLLGQVLVLANVPSLSLGLIGCNVRLCSDSTCNILGGVAGPVNVSLGL